MATYTLHDVLDMQVGDELDKLIAVALFNLDITTEIIKSPIEDFEDYTCRDSEGNYIGELPNYSENISQAYSVMEKMGIVAIPKSTNNGFSWYACDIEKVSYRGSEIAITPLHDSGISADTLPEAVCKAALISLLG